MAADLCRDALLEEPRDDKMRVLNYPIPPSWALSPVQSDDDGENGGGGGGGGPSSAAQPLPANTVPAGSRAAGGSKAACAWRGSESRRPASWQG